VAADAGDLTRTRVGDGHLTQANSESDVAPSHRANLRSRPCAGGAKGMASGHKWEVVSNPQRLPRDKP
jgi:hypothetical protein